MTLSVHWSDSTEHILILININQLWLLHISNPRTPFEFVQSLDNKTLTQIHSRVYSPDSKTGIFQFKPIQLQLVYAIRICGYTQ